MKENLEISRYLLESTKTGGFNTRRTLSGLFFLIPLAPFGINTCCSFGVYREQTNKHSELYV